MKTIIEMAREAGAVTTSQFTDVGVELFAALVRADEREAMVAEAAKKGWGMRNDDPFEDCVREIADIRARGQTEERNFCPRCGKRTADPTTIHTCTPPQGNT